MALTDVNFQEGDGQGLVNEIVDTTYSGTLTDLDFEPQGSQFPVLETPLIVDGGGGNIFVISD